MTWKSSGGGSPPEYSPTLRKGIADTVAILGAVRGGTTLPSGGTGATFAGQIVHDTLNGATAAQWRGVADLLPELAEANPNAFLDAVEESLSQSSPSIIALFNERADDLGMWNHSAHTHLLWAIEHLAFSPAHLSRVVIVLGRLALGDPGGTLSNRPASSLLDILNLIHPQSAADASSRLAAVDALRTSVPQASWPLLLGLIEGLRGAGVLNRGPRYQDWPRSEVVPSPGAVLQAVTEIGERIIDDIQMEPGRWVQAMCLVTKLAASSRARLFAEVGTVWDQLPDGTQRALIAELQEQVSRHTTHRDALWALDEDEIFGLTTFVQSHATKADEPGPEALFSHRRIIDGHDRLTPEGMAALNALRDDAVREALPDQIPALAAASTVPVFVGVALAEVTAEQDDEVLGWLASAESHLRSVGQGLASVRLAHDPLWLWRTIEAHPALEIELLLSGSLNYALIKHVDAMEKDDQAAFWSKVDPWQVPDESRVTVAQRLVDQDRPFSAMNLLFRVVGDTIPVGLGLEIMTKPLTGTTESIKVLESPEYVMGGMLDGLGAAGAPAERLGIVEWGYHLALADARVPRAFNEMLASDPELFARLVTLSTHSPSRVDEEAAQEHIEPKTSDDECGFGDDGNAANQEDRDDSHWLFPNTPDVRTKATDILRHWRVPLPGASGDEPPESAALQDWVDRARAALTVLDPLTAGAHQVGHAMSGPCYDPDGTWPCRAVRDVLEHENDPGIESGLRTGRMNDRGVTTRSAYSGGQQERDIATKYGRWANDVRGRWPRAGALLDSIAGSYQRDALSEDRSADERGDQ